MRLIEDSDVSVRVLDDNQPVLVYNHGAIVNVDVPETDARRKRACYVHPLWGVNGETLTEDEVRNFCRGQIAHLKVPRYVRFVTEYPMTVTGKIRKVEMREMMAKELYA